MKKVLLFLVNGLICLFITINVSVAQDSFPPDRSPLIVDGTLLKINDCSGRRFFAAGMVDNIPNSGLQLSLYDHDEMENQFLYHKAMKATGMRWNAFLRGRDLRWDANGYVTGMCDNAVANLKDGCDLAYKHGMVLQIVLSTAHFLQYGWDGQTPENVERVNNNKFMYENLAGTQAYINNVIIPIIQGIGTHPGLFGYCIINEASGMYYPEDAPTGTWSDVKVHLADFQKFINRVASAIKTHQPGALLSVSGVASGIAQFNDAALINAAGHTNGLMDIHQIQFYPDNHGENWSPYLHTPAELIATFGGDSKPMICGETPIEGIIDKNNGRFKGSEEFGLEEAYTRLWNNGHSGGWTWSNRVYERADPAKQDVIEAAYTNFYNNYLVNNDFNGDQCSAAGFQQDSGSDKIVSMEAENYHFNTPGSGVYSTHSWISTSTPTGYSGAGAMVTDPNNGANISNVSTAEANAPRLEFTVNFVATGTHYIWLRVNTNGSSGDDSVHAGLNGTISAVRLECGTSSDWVWKSYKSDGNRPTINVPSTGEHTFGLFMREDGMRVDKIVLTTNVNYTPTGTGPAESQNNGAGLKSVNIATSVKLPAINNEIN